MTGKSSPRSIVVLSAHSGDFVWRAGGAIAHAAETGAEVRVICLSFGERGESQGLWADPDMTLETVKIARRKEASEAADILGAHIEFLDLGDYPLNVTSSAFDEIVDHLRRAEPDLLLTHVANDPYNRDHNLAHETLLRARMVAQAQGHKTDAPPIGAPQILMFEPHQPEMCGFVPNLLLDITGVFDRKQRAMQCMSAQQHLVDYYTDLAQRRGVQAVRNGGARSIRYAEAHQRVFPVVSEELI
ncbi:PIG-L deacetylase family protein [Nocardia fusca]|uniref:PIG-L deacetylase family protein n=1 Tax=Nocardia fusca TaxID=941183 RepID=UPI0037B8DA52